RGRREGRGAASSGPRRVRRDGAGPALRRQRGEPRGPVRRGGLISMTSLVDTSTGPKDNSPHLRPDGCFPYLTLPRWGPATNQTTQPPHAAPRCRASHRSEPLLVMPGPLGASVRSGEYAMQPAQRPPCSPDATVEDELNTALREHQSGRLEQAARI